MIVNYNLWQVGWQLCLITGLAVLKLYISAPPPPPLPLPCWAIWVIVKYCCRGAKHRYYCILNCCVRTRPVVNRGKEVTIPLRHSRIHTFYIIHKNNIVCVHLIFSHYFAHVRQCSRMFWNDMCAQNAFCYSAKLFNKIWNISILLQSAHTHARIYIYDNIMMHLYAVDSVTRCFDKLYINHFDLNVFYNLTSSE